MLSIMGEQERTQEYGNEIHCQVHNFAKFLENTSYIHTCTIQGRRKQICIGQAASSAEYSSQHSGVEISSIQNS